MAKNNRSFTMIELLIVVSAMILFTAITLPRFNTYNQQQRLKSNANKLVEVLELAKKKSSTSDINNPTAAPTGFNCPDFAGYRVSIASDSYRFSIFCNAAYQLIQEYKFDTNITTVVGTGNLDFPPLANNINLSINSIRLKNSSISQCLDISISPIGIISTSTSLVGC